MKDNNYYLGDYITADRIIFAAVIIFAIVLACFGLTNIAGNITGASNNEVQALEVNYEIDYINHVVKPGESISYIAEVYIGDYPGSFSEYQSLICRNNGISNPNRIGVGDIIRVPIYTEVVTD